jgi:glucan biosynthesis protein C
MHLWFLWYLVLFYAATLVVVRVTRGRSVPADVAASLTTGRWSLVIWASLTMLTLLPMDRPVIELSALLLPDPRPVVAYAVFFLFGWLLYRGRAGLGRLAAWWSWRAAAVGIGASVAGYGVIGAVQRHPASVHIVACLMVAVWMWLLVLASFGAFLRYAHRQQPIVRYLSDAAYWIYIVHLPVVIWTAGLLSRATLHAGLKFAIVFTVTTVVCVASYHAFVRRSAIGQLLNGRRYGLVPGTP